MTAFVAKVELEIRMKIWSTAVKVASKTMMLQRRYYNCNALPGNCQKD